MSLCNWVFQSWQTYKIARSKPVKYVNDYNFIAKCLWCTTSSVFTHHSRNAESYHSMQQNNLDHFTEGENHNVKNAACCFEFVPRRAGSTCGGGEWWWWWGMLKLKSCLGLWAESCWNCERIQSKCECESASLALLIWHASSANRLPVSKIPGCFQLV